MMSNEKKAVEEIERQYASMQKSTQYFAQCIMNCASCFGAIGCPYFNFYTEMEPVYEYQKSYDTEQLPKLTRSLEDYLEVIFVIEQIKGRVRSVDVAEFLHYAKPSVSHAVKLLKKGNYLTIDNDGY